MARWRCLCPQLLGSSFLAAVDSAASHQRVTLSGLVVLSAADSGQLRSYLVQIEDSGDKRGFEASPKTVTCNSLLLLVYR